MFPEGRGVVSAVFRARISDRSFCTVVDTSTLELRSQPRARGGGSTVVRPAAYRRSRVGLLLGSFSERNRAPLLPQKKRLFSPVIEGRLDGVTFRDNR